MVLLLGAVCPASSTYRLLWEFNQNGDQAYWIGIDSWAKEAQLKELVCRVIATEKPSGYHRLKLSFLYRMEPFRWVPPPDYGEKLVAAYRWNVKLPDSKIRLAIFVDPSSQRLPKPRFVSLDHRRECD